MSKNCHVQETNILPFEKNPFEELFSKYWVINNETHFYPNFGGTHMGRGRIKEISTLSDIPFLTHLKKTFRISWQTHKEKIIVGLKKRFGHENN